MRAKQAEPLTSYSSAEAQKRTLLEFRRIASNQLNWGYKNTNFKQLTWEPKFVDKRCNSTGLQLADLVARPIGLRMARPTETNHAYDVLSKKIAFGGLKWFP